MLARQRGAVAAALAAAWDQLDTYDEEAVEGFVARVLPLIEGAKAATVATSTSFNSSMLGVRTPSVPASAIDVALDLRSPFTATWHALSQARPYQEAVLAGRSAMEATGETYIQSVARQTGDVVAAKAKVRTKWERVAESGSCEWCKDRDGGIYLLASDGDYGHDNCNCDVVPFIEA